MFNYSGLVFLIMGAVIEYIGPNIDKLIEDPMDELDGFKEKMEVRKRILIEDILIPLIGFYKLDTGIPSERSLRALNGTYNSEIEAIEDSLLYTVEMKRFYRNLKRVMIYGGLVSIVLGFFIFVPISNLPYYLAYLAMSSLVGIFLLAAYIYYSYWRSKRTFRGVKKGMEERDKSIYGNIAGGQDYE